MSDKINNLSKPAKALEGREIIEALTANDLRGQVRALFSKWFAHIEQEAMQRRAPSPLELRRMELQAAEELIAKVQSYV